MAKVVPTVLAATPTEYVVMMERASSLSERVHVDVSDGQFTEQATLNPAQITIPKGVQLDVHLMVEKPAEYLETVLSLHPELVIFHAESAEDLEPTIRHARELGVKAGIALLQHSQPTRHQSLIEQVDHVLVFTGQLGRNGGQLDIDQLVKVAEIRKIKPDVEISVDGGVNDQNAALIVMRDVNVLYAGSYLQNAKDPQTAFDTIAKQAEGRA